MSWSDYYKSKDEQRSHPLLEYALAIYDFKKHRKTVIDLGCGSGNESYFLLKKGWKVTALDNNQEALDFLKNKITPELEKMALLHRISFLNIANSINLPKSTLVIAFASLSFCEPSVFKNLWQTIEKSIVKEGVFVGDFFGKSYEGSESLNMTFFNLEEVKELFCNFKISFFSETEYSSKDFSGRSKYIHSFSVIAKKL